MRPTDGLPHRAQLEYADGTPVLASSATKSATIFVTRSACEVAVDEPPADALVDAHGGAHAGAHRTPCRTARYPARHGIPRGVLFAQRTVATSGRPLPGSE